MEKGYLWYKGAHQRISAIDRQGSVGIRRKGGRDGLIRKEGVREIKNRGPTSPRIVTPSLSTRAVSQLGDLFTDAHRTDTPALPFGDNLSAQRIRPLCDRCLFAQSRTADPSSTSTPSPTITPSPSNCLYPLTTDISRPSPHLDFDSSNTATDNKNNKNILGIATYNNNNNNSSSNNNNFINSNTASIDIDSAADNNNNTNIANTIIANASDPSSPQNLNDIDIDLSTSNSNNNSNSNSDAVHNNADIINSTFHPPSLLLSPAFTPFPDSLSDPDDDNVPPDLPTSDKADAKIEKTHPCSRSRHTPADLHDDALTRSFSSADYFPFAGERVVQTQHPTAREPQA